MPQLTDEMARAIDRDLCRKAALDISGRFTLYRFLMFMPFYVVMIAYSVLATTATNILYDTTPDPSEWMALIVPVLMLIAAFIWALDKVDKRYEIAFKKAYDKHLDAMFGTFHEPILKEGVFAQGSVAPDDTVSFPIRKLDKASLKE